MPRRRYSDEQLAEAVAGSRSWRGVLRHLGLSATSSAQIRSVRSRADELGLDHVHFTGQRRWTDDDLEDAVAASRSWTEVAVALGLAVGASTTALKGHAARLGINSSHLGAPRSRGGQAPAPELVHLPRAGSMLAAAWFQLCGFEVAWPLEPSAYDLVVRRDETTWRVQVKTTRMRAAEDWRVTLTTSGRRPAPYDPDDVDQFFVVDGEMRYFLIPLAVVGGRGALHLRGYQDFRVPRDPSTPVSSRGEG